MTPTQKEKVTKTIEGWVNVYGGAGASSQLFWDRHSADIYPDNKHRIACVRVTGSWECEE